MFAIRDTARLHMTSWLSNDSISFLIRSNDCDINVIERINSRGDKRSWSSCHKASDNDGSISSVRPMYLLSTHYKQTRLERYTVWSTLKFQRWSLRYITGNDVSRQPREYHMQQLYQRQQSQLGSLKQKCNQM
jgi:hypothetical protein